MPVWKAAAEQHCLNLTLPKLHLGEAEELGKGQLEPLIDSRNSIGSREGKIPWSETLGQIAEKMHQSRDLGGSIQLNGYKCQIVGAKKHVLLGPE